MKKTDKKIIVAKVLGTVALEMSKVAANSRCVIIYHQPKFPENIKKLRKF